MLSYIVIIDLFIKYLSCINYILVVGDIELMKELFEGILFDGYYGSFLILLF